jgi:methyltransferase-like protein
LQYLGDAEPVRDDVRDLPWPAEDWIEARQYGDFLACRKFRESLLCRKDIRLDRSLSLDRFLALAAASRVQPAGPQADGAQKFELSQGRSLTTNHPLVKDVLCFLASRWPGSVPVAALPLGDRPAASPLARLQLSLGLTMVTNQRHQSIDLPDESGRLLISLLDGTRDREALAAAMARAAPGPEGTPADPAAIGKALDVSLREMFRLCLLHAR